MLIVILDDLLPGYSLQMGIDFIRVKSYTVSWFFVAVLDCTKISLASVRCISQFIRNFTDVKCHGTKLEGGLMTNSPKYCNL